jgi:hypothetical protein
LRITPEKVSDAGLLCSYAPATKGRFNITDTRVGIGLISFIAYQQAGNGGNQAGSQHAAEHGAET